MATSISTLSNVVSKLVRASMGSAVSDSVPDEDLDRTVAEMILKEAREKEVRYHGKEGLRAYLPHTGLPENNLPKPNKRFLTSMLRNVDDHNASVIKQQERAAAEAREEREEEERKERRRREADVAKERMRRLLGGARRRDGGGSRAPRGRERSRSRERRREDEDLDDNEPLSPRLSSYRDRPRTDTRYGSHRRDETSDRREKRRRDEDSDYDSPPRARRRDDDDDRRRKDHEKEGRRTRPHRDDSDRTRASHDRHRRDRVSDEDGHKASRNRSSSRERKRRKLDDAPAAVSEAGPSRSLSHNSTTPLPTSSSSSHPRLPSEEPLSPTPGPPSPISKMDRYFEATYDPRMDIAPISKEGFVEPGQFEGWDHMLSILKIRKEEKRLREWEEEAERLSGRGKKDKKGKAKGKDKDKGRPVAELIAEQKKLLLASTQKETGLMEVVYRKKGEAREWDKGKVVT